MKSVDKEIIKSFEYDPKGIPESIGLGYQTFFEKTASQDCEV